ncbi:hypothetical protein ABPG74_017588 [Tetrahymena malaccensis]
MLIQDEQVFSSPLEYDLQNQTLSRSDYSNQKVQNHVLNKSQSNKKEIKKVEKKSSLDEIEEKIEGETNKIPSFFEKQRLFGFMRKASKQQINGVGSCQYLNNISNIMTGSPTKQNAQIFQQEQFTNEKSSGKSQTNIQVENQSLPNQFQENQECLRKSESNILSFSDKALSANSIQKMFSYIKPVQNKEINNEANQNNSNYLQKLNSVLQQK